MSYYYVKSPGAGSPAATTKQTGSWPAAYYASIAAAITAGAGAGDTIVCSDSHALSNAGNYTITGPSGGVLTIVSVSDTACDTYSAGASETTTTGGDVTFSGGFIVSSGVDYTTDDWFFFTAVNDLVFNDCTFTMTNSANLISSTGDFCNGRFNNCIIDLKHNNNRFDIQGGSVFEFYGCTFSATTSGSIDDLFRGNFQNGGATIKFIGCDLSVVSGATQYIIGEVGSDATADDLINVTISNCKLGASTPIVEETLISRNHSVLVTNSSSSSAGAEYGYWYKTRAGIAQESTTFYRDSSTAWPSTAKTSIKVDTDTNVSQTMPFTFQFPAMYADLTSASSDALKFYLLCADSLTDADVWIDVYYRDGTNKHVANHAASVANAFTEMRTPSALTSNTDTWTGRTTENRYEITVSTSGDPGTDCVPIIIIRVAKDTIVYFDTTVDLV